MEQLPSLISTKNLLWDVGIYSGIKIDEIETTKENNPYNINQAGREVSNFPCYCFWTSELMCNLKPELMDIHGSLNIPIL